MKLENNHFIRSVMMVIIWRSLIYSVISLADDRLYSMIVIEFVVCSCSYHPKIVGQIAIWASKILVIIHTSPNQGKSPKEQLAENIFCTKHIWVGHIFPLQICWDNRNVKQAYASGGSCVFVCAIILLSE